MIPLLRTAVKFGDRQQINSQWGQSPLRLSWQWSELQRNAHQKYFVTLALHLCNEETGYFLKTAKLGLSSKQRICYVVFNLRYVRSRHMDSYRHQPTTSSILPRAVPTTKTRREKVSLHLECHCQWTNRASEHQCSYQRLSACFCEASTASLLTTLLK